MALTLNGSSNTIGGLAVGGVPDATIDADALAANAVTAGKLASGVGGKIVNYQSYSTSSEVSSTSTSYVDTGLSGAITTTGSNKVLVIVSQQLRIIRASSQAFGGVQILRGSTVIETGANNASGSQPFGLGGVNDGCTNIERYLVYNRIYLDSPSAGTHTYKTQMAVLTSQNSAQIRAQYQASGENGSSYLTLLELAV